MCATRRFGHFLTLYICKITYYFARFVAHHQNFILRFPIRLPQFLLEIFLPYKGYTLSPLASRFCELPRPLLVEVAYFVFAQSCRVLT